MTKTKVSGRRSKRRRVTRRRAGGERPRLQPRVPEVRALAAPTPTPRAGETIELETAFSDASLEMDETGEKFRVGPVLQTHVGAGGAAHAIAVPGAAGFLSVADKAKLDAIVPGGGIGSEIWAPPATPHVLNDEFTGTTLDPLWLPYQQIPFSTALTAAPTALDFTTPINIASQTAIQKVRASCARRPSWLQVQPGGNPGGPEIVSYYLLKAFSLQPDQAFWARVASHAQTSVNGNYGFAFGLALFGAASGAPDPANSMLVTLYQDQASYMRKVVTVTTGGTALGTPLVNETIVDLHVLSHVLSVQKIGNVYRAMFGDEHGNTTLYPSHIITSNIAFAYAGIWFNGSIGRINIYSFDFFRAANGNVLPL